MEYLSCVRSPQSSWGIKHKTVHEYTHTKKRYLGPGVFPRYLDKKVVSLTERRLTTQGHIALCLMCENRL